jgi:hypothetical protein
MFPPELESKKVDFRVDPSDSSRSTLGRHPKALLHAWIAFTLSSLAYAYALGGRPLYYVLAIAFGPVLAMRWGRSLGTLRSIYGFAIVFAALALIVGVLK